MKRRLNRYNSEFYKMMLMFDSQFRIFSKSKQNSASPAQQCFSIDPHSRERHKSHDKQDQVASVGNSFSPLVVRTTWKSSEVNY